MMQQERVLFWMDQLRYSYTQVNEKKISDEVINLKVLQGEQIVISGLKNYEKSGFKQVLGCINRPVYGKYIFDYVDVNLFSDKELSIVRNGRISFLLADDKRLFDYTVFKYVELPILYSSLSDVEKVKRIKETLEKTGLNEYSDLTLFELSEEQREMANIARTIVNKPIFIIADEPESHVITILNSFCDNLSLLIFSDDENVINGASRHIIFENNRILSDEVLGGDSSK